MNLKNARIIFIGTSFFAKELLKNLIEKEIEIRLVITQPDKPAGRKKELKPSEVKIFAQKNKLKIEQFSKLDSQALTKIKTLEPDLIIVAAYGMIIPLEILAQPQFGCINIHTSLLPKLRGSCPIQTALLQGLEETGITMMKMNIGIDSGDLIFQEKIKIDSQDTYPVLENKLIEATNQILIPTLNNYLKEKIKPKPQNHSQASWTKIIKKTDGKIDWTDSAEKIYNQFKAFYLWPQIHTFWTINGKTKKIILNEISKSEISEKNRQSGEVYQKNNQTLIQTTQGSIVLKKIQLEGKNKLSIKDFLNGNPKLIHNVLK